MIDFAGIPKRVCSDSKLRCEFLNDPLKVTEQLLSESYVELPDGGLHAVSPGLGTTAVISTADTREADVLIHVSP